MAGRGRTVKYKRTKSNTYGHVETKSQPVILATHALLPCDNKKPSQPVPPQHAALEDTLLQPEIHLPMSHKYSDLKSKEMTCWRNLKEGIWDSYVCSQGLPKDVQCVECNQERADVRCKDCCPTYYVCQKCAGPSHKHCPLHSLEIWQVCILKPAWKYIYIYIDIDISLPKIFAAVKIAW